MSKPLDKIAVLSRPELDMGTCEIDRIQLETSVDDLYWIGEKAYLAVRHKGQAYKMRYRPKPRIIEEC